MTAYEIAKPHYDLFEDTTEITALLTSIFCREKEYRLRYDDAECDIITGIGAGFREGVQEAVAEDLKIEFLQNRRASNEIKELCEKIIKEMKY